MYLTQEEAAERTCPVFALVQVATGVVRSAVGDGTSLEVASASAALDEATATSKCLGAACMAWRAESVKYGQDKPAETKGYCGIAGRPADGTPRVLYR